jgi:hypothetical protein
MPQKQKRDNGGSLRLTASGEPSDETTRANIIEKARRIFHGVPIEEEGHHDHTASHLAMIDSVLMLTDEQGRSSYTQSQIDSCMIGLRGSAGTRPDVDKMLDRLRKAKGSALSWRKLARRMRAHG